MTKKKNLTNVENGDMDERGKTIEVPHGPASDVMMKSLPNRPDGAKAISQAERTGVDAPDEHGYFKTELHICCAKGDHKEAEALLDRGANPNIECKDGYNAFHYSLLDKSFKCMELLVRRKGTDVAAKSPKGLQVLFNLAGFASWTISDKEAYLKCMKLLLERPDVEANTPNHAGRTALHEAVRGSDWEERVRVMLEAGGDKIDVDWQKSVLGRSLRKTIERKFPSLSPLLPQRKMEAPESPDLHAQLLYQVQCKNVDGVKATLEEARAAKGSTAALKDELNRMYGEPYHCSLLHLVSRVKGFEEFIPLFIEYGADPNSKHPTGDYPILLAAEALNPKAVRLLLDSGKVDVTVVNAYLATALHLVTHCIDPDEDEMGDIMQVLKLLLDYKPSPDALRQNGHAEMNALDVNAADKFKDTALHNAAYFGLEEALLLLVQSGGDLLRRNDAKEAVIDYVEPTTMEKILDEQIKSNGLPHQNRHLQLTFKFDSIVPCLKDDDDSKVREMDIINSIKNNKDLRHLIAHPLISLFIALKWEKVKTFFIVNLVCYSVFVMCLTAYFVVFFSCLRPNCNVALTGNDTMRNETVGVTLSSVTNGSDMWEVGNITYSPELSDVLPNNTNNTECPEEYGTVSNTSDSLDIQNVSSSPEQSEVWPNNTNSTECPEKYGTDSETTVTLLSFFTLSFLLILTVREITQMAISKWQYFRSRENILEIFLIIGTLLIVTNLLSHEILCKCTVSLLILLAWIDLILMTGKLPCCSLQLEMFEEVAGTFFVFCLWYFLIIIAFGFSFSVLFHDVKPFFLNPYLSVFKTFVMISGELEASFLFENVNIISHIIFLLFVLTVPIVLINLLNGLAVHDTQKIRENATVCSIASLASLVSYIENSLEILRKIFKRLTPIEKLLKNRLRLFDHELPHRQIHVYQENRKVIFHLDETTTEKFKNYKMCREEMKKAADVVKKRKKIAHENN